MRRQTCSAVLVAAAILTAAGAAAQAGPQKSIWEGVYTKAQDARGAAVSSANCARCHGSKLNGAGEADAPQSPAISGESFLRHWDGKSMQMLFEYVKTQMPSDNPGAFTDQECVDAIAHMLAVSDIPAGDSELVADSKVLEGIVVKEKR